MGGTARAKHRTTVLKAVVGQKSGVRMNRRELLKRSSAGFTQACLDPGQQRGVDHTVSLAVKRETRLALDARLHSALAMGNFGFAP